MQVAVPMFIVLTLATVPTYFWLSDVRCGDNSVQYMIPAAEKAKGFKIP